MLNKYPLWKNLLILIVVLIGVVYALPNFYPDDYAIQITGARSGATIDQRTLERATAALEQADIQFQQPEISEGGGDALIRLGGAEEQLKAKAAVQAAVGDDYVVALNLAETTPEWLAALGAGPMTLGLDLRGGVHFMLEVDMAAAVEQRLEVYSSEIKRRLRDERIRYRGGAQEGDRSIVLQFQSEAVRDEAASEIRSDYDQFRFDTRQQGDVYELVLTLSDAAVQEIKDYALAQNLTTLRNRVNELGVAEPLVQRQGDNQIVVELPGVQDTAQAKRVLGATANLEFRLEARSSASDAETVRMSFRDEPNRTARLEREIIVTGESVSNAQQGFDDTGTPQVNITLDSVGGSAMTRATRNAIQRRMAVVFIEHTSELAEDGESRVRETQQGIISLATIQSTLGSDFRITGLESISEAAELALLLRAGSLAAPMYFVEERTIGPSLGAKNIEAGVLSVQIGFAAVFLFMLVYYRLFGLVANISLTVNLILLVAAMSIISATLTLPGIAGIVLTVGMAVDANVLIFERIKEELREGVPPQSAINAGYGRAFVSIVDANITTLLVAVILFAVGTGPVKGFAVTLSLGILTSLFTSILLGRAIINGVIGGKKLESLSI
ncbi:protein translocase subunit SecD [Hydrocarboniclastica marina]|uniref:Protein translocase subunit SecD n=1 Tax=Hydrocarboniclastica marina TaxID=2259620 RepID=A0A4P7XJ33_9ALTE|nr:protein translocase subunit SecD [Hydrocarboniclastica marina]QCF25867.1 protein translocase subunit SecD [Hydrocarboniclastica marina]